MTYVFKINGHVVTKQQFAKKTRHIHGQTQRSVSGSVITLNFVTTHKIFR